MVNAKEESTLTPRERAKLRKAERAQREFEMLTKAAADARLNSSIVRTLKNQELHGTRNSLIPNNQPAKLEQTASSGFDEVNNRTMDYSSRHDGTITKSYELEKMPHTEYDKPWYPNQS